MRTALTPETVTISLARQRADRLDREGRHLAAANYRSLAKAMTFHRGDYEATCSGRAGEAPNA